MTMVSPSNGLRTTRGLLVASACVLQFQWRLSKAPVPPARSFMSQLHNARDSKKVRLAVIVVLALVIAYLLYSMS